MLEIGSIWKDKDGIELLKIKSFNKFYYNCEILFSSHTWQVGRCITYIEKFLLKYYEPEPNFIKKKKLEGVRHAEPKI